MKDIHIEGLWHVTTEGDCEGRSTKDLGTHYGRIDDIAFALGDQGGYSLRFDSVDARGWGAANPNRQTVNISLGIESKTWDLAPNDRLEFFRRLFASSKTTVEECPYYASVTLRRTPSHDDLVASAKFKLTPAELGALAANLTTGRRG